MITVIFLCCILIILYSRNILQYRLGWDKLKSHKISVEHTDTSVSIIVAFRNEADRLKNIASCIGKQSYPKHLTEIIFVNDNSTDNFKEIIRAFPSITLLHLENKTGKHAAIKAAIAHAKNELLVCTDADCCPGNDWLLSIVSFYNTTKADMILSPVLFSGSQKIPGKLLELEFASLMASTAGAVATNKATMSNGANIAFKKSAIPQSASNEYTSGDDVFLLHSFKKANKKIAFNIQNASLVTTHAPANMSSFVNQRLRWTAKSKQYTDRDTIYAAILVFSTSLSIMLLAIAAIFAIEYGFIALALFVLKTVVDSILLVPFLRYYHRTYLIKLIIPVEMFYFIYITLIVVLSALIPVSWKGRQL